MSSEVMHEVYALGAFRVDIKMPGLRPCPYRGFRGKVLGHGLVLGLVQGPPSTWGLSVLKGRRSTRHRAGEEVQSNENIEEQAGAAGHSSGPGIRRYFLRLGGGLFDRQPDAGPSTVRGS